MAEFLATIVVAAVIGVLVVLCMWGSSVSCHSSWAKSGMATSWGPIQGCLVQTKDGHWIPEDRYREINP